MRNIKLTVAYEGTAYHGFQDQGPTLPTIQRRLEQGIRRLTSEDIRVTGAGRTDAGVHALGQVVNFRTESAIPLDRWPHAMNSVLPDDIVVHHAEQVRPDFHSRYYAVRKTYRYSMSTSAFPNVLSRRFTYHVREAIDVERMREASRCLLGENDFAAFQGTGSSVKTTVRRLDELQIESTAEAVQISVSANGFLYNMVRIIVGTLLEVGRGKRPASWVEDVLKSLDRNTAGPTASALGLCLVSVEYPADK